MAATTQPKIFRKIEVIEGGGHHGGGWKVAYADFMTAMMAFFLLMWILASADEQKLRGIAEYFTDASMPGGIGVLDGATLGPAGTLTASNGAVVARGTQLGMVDDPAPAKWEIRDTTQSSDVQQSDEEMKSKDGAADEHENSSSSAADAAHDAILQDMIKQERLLDEQKFAELEKDLLQAMQEHPELEPLMKNIMFEKTPDGFLIQIIDQEGQPMFVSGRAEMQTSTLKLIESLGSSLSKLPNRIVLSGHTDSIKFQDSKVYDNWDLSSDRANATRRVFESSGVSLDRIIRVSGLADTQALVPENPEDPSNRRISVLLKYNAPKDAPQTNDIVKDKPETTGHVEQKDSQHADATADHVKEENLAAVDDQVFENLLNVLR